MLLEGKGVSAPPAAPAVSLFKKHSLTWTNMLGENEDMMA